MPLIFSSDRTLSGGKFRQLVCLEPTGITEGGKLILEKYSEHPIRQYDSLAVSEHEVIERIGNADAILLRWRTRLSRNILSACPNLRYIGLCCSYFSPEATNIDVPTVIERNIAVSAIFDYGDEGVVEFIIAHLLSRFGRYFDAEIDGEPSELSGFQLGILGLGTTGMMVANAARHLGMKVRYFSRTRKQKAEASGIGYLPLSELMRSSDVISTHLPRHTRILDTSLLSLTKPGALLVNTSLGPTFKMDDFLDWIHQASHSALFDEDGLAGTGDILRGLPRTWILNRGSGWTYQARERLTEKALDNIRTYLGIPENPAS